MVDAFGSKEKRTKCVCKNEIITSRMKRKEQDGF